MLLTININTIINMFGGDYKEEKVIEVIDNINNVYWSVLLVFSQQRYKINFYPHSFLGIK